MVVNGQLAAGLTDTDDALGAVEKGEPVEMIFPDQEEGGLGTLIVPNTIALISGANHPEEGKQLMDYLLSRKVEKELVEAGWTNLSIRGSGGGEADASIPEVKGMKANLEEIYKYMEQSKSDMQKLFVR
jgi:iron(III) transport system substrate-binding protein